MRLVLLHGLGTGPEAWQPQVEALGVDREVLTPSLRLGGGFAVEREADRLWAELPAGEIDLCGLSLGALVALRMALDRTSRVRRLVLCAAFASLPRRYRLLQAAVGTAASLAPPRARGELGDLGPGEIRALFRAGRRFDVSAELRRLALPALVLVGERDRVNASLAARLARGLPNARLQVVPGAGHVANVDAPEEFSARVRAFLDE